MPAGLRRSYGDDHLHFLTAVVITGSHGLVVPLRCAAQFVVHNHLFSGCAFANLATSWIQSLAHLVTREILGSLRRGP
jgi:hypothetical protein